MAVGKAGALLETAAAAAAARAASEIQDRIANRSGPVGVFAL